MDIFEEDLANEISRDQIDDDAYHKEIKTIWDSNEQRVEELQQEQQVSEWASIFNFIDFILILLV